MQKLKVSAIEILTALGLMTIVRVYLELLNESRLIHPSLVKGELIAFYGVLALCSEVLIVAAFQPMKSLIIWSNLLLAAVIALPGWTNRSYLKSLLFAGLITAMVRIAVALISGRVRNLIARRFAAAVMGALLLAEAVWRVINLGQQTYFNYYFFPRFKQGYIAPTRWEDLLAMCVLWSLQLVLFYVSCRLLKYAFQSRMPKIRTQA